MLKNPQWGVFEQLHKHLNGCDKNPDKSCKVIGSKCINKMLDNAKNILKNGNKNQLEVVGSYHQTALTALMMWAARQMLPTEKRISR